MKENKDTQKALAHYLGMLREALLLTLIRQLGELVKIRKADEQKQ
jgi:hypothetical protein